MVSIKEYHNNRDLPLSLSPSLTLSLIHTHTPKCFPLQLQQQTTTWMVTVAFPSHLSTQMLEVTRLSAINGVKKSQQKTHKQC